jgi:hypothetical protein
MHCVLGCWKQVLYNYLNVPFLGLKRAVLERQLQQVEAELKVRFATLYTINTLHNVIAAGVLYRASTQLVLASNHTLYVSIRST